MKATIRDEWIRCGQCGHKLLRGRFGWGEVKCHSCKTVNEIGTQYEKLEFLLANAGIPYMTMISDGGASGSRQQSLTVILNNADNITYKINQKFDADEEFGKIAEQFGFFRKEADA